MRKTEKNRVPVPEKMQAVYDAVCALIEEGRDAASLTVSEITNRAGIGKGTAYEYFDSKEEMIGGAVCARITLLQEEALAMLRTEKTLRGQIGCILDMFENHQTDMLFYQLIREKMPQFDDPGKMQAAVGDYALQKEQFDLAISHILMKTAGDELMMDARMEDTQAELMISTMINLVREICFSRKAGGRWAHITRETLIDTCMMILKKLLTP